MDMKTTLMVIAFAPLAAAAIAGLFGRRIGRIGAHTITIGAVGLSCVLSIRVLMQFINGEASTFNENLGRVDVRKHDALGPDCQAALALVDGAFDLALNDKIFTCRKLALEVQRFAND